MKPSQDLPKDEKLEICIEENVLVQTENLRTHPSVLAALAGGRLRLHAWVYEIESGNEMAFNDRVVQYLSHRGSRSRCGRASRSPFGHP